MSDPVLQGGLQNPRYTAALAEMSALKDTSAVEKYKVCSYNPCQGFLGLVRLPMLGAEVHVHTVRPMLVDRDHDRVVVARYR